MRVYLLILLFGLAACHDPTDDFSEFDSPEIFDNLPAPEAPKPQNPETSTAKPVDVVDTFEQEEFEPYEDEFEKPQEAETPKSDQTDPKPLEIVNVPFHLRLNWSSYQVEALMVVVILLYGANFLIGRGKNSTMATNWYMNSTVLSEQFSLVGDESQDKDAVGGHLIKETDYNYVIWSTGRVGLKAMSSQLKLIKRQDLVGLAMNTFTPRKDRVVHKIELDIDEIDTFVFAFGLRKSLVKIVKEFTDMSNFTSEKKPQFPTQYPIPANFTVFSEISETIPAILDTSFLQFVNQFPHLFEYIHISDQYSGPKPTEESFKLPEFVPTITFSFFIDEESNTQEIQSLFLNFVFYTLDRLRRYKLSREGKAKADKKRRAVEEAYLKNTHAQRQEIAQARREEKEQARKQKLLDESDPEKQKKLQKLEDKKNSKVRLPKMKQLRGK